MTNFDFLKNYKDFDTFSETAINAEELYPKFLKESVINCQRALEAAVKWMFSVDQLLTTWRNPNEVTLFELMRVYEFKSLLGNIMFKKIDFIRIKGNDIKHNPRAEIKKREVEICLENLFYFYDYIAKLYEKNYTQQPFKATLLKGSEEACENKNLVIKDVSLNDLLEKNKNQKEELTKRREENKNNYNPPAEKSEFETRKIYIDEMIKDAGFVIGKDCREEVEVKNMPNLQGKGFADYVLYDDSDTPLALIEAKRMCKSPSEGRHQAELYADYFEKEYGKRPVIFLTNGFETYIKDNKYNERSVSSIYSKKDLEKLYNLNRENIKDVEIDEKIAGRYYQKIAVKSVVESFNDYRRKALLVMATGSGKTRTVASLIDVLQKNRWVEKILFLTDRTALITQAKRAFTNLLPDLTLTSLNSLDFDKSARCVFSTYQTMINKIDELKENSTRLFTPGYFDIIIIDEAHRSIYKKYKDIFSYFDCLIVGLTATPKSEINKNTYDEFDLENGIPTYSYDLEQAVNDKFLVSYKVDKSSTKFMSEGIIYDNLSEEDREEYENTFENEEGEIPKELSSAFLNDYIFNEDTIKKVLDQLMTKGYRVDMGDKIGKTIIFAENHNHAEAILKVFNKEYSNLKDVAQVIDNKINYAQDLIDNFSDEKKLPRIAISVDMLDTGIDVPEILNLVFFKKVYSKSKFHQMIGRGTRLCPGLLDGRDKEGFLIFDPCGNFDFFAMNEKEIDSPIQTTLQSALFNIEIEIIHKLQENAYKEEIFKNLRENLVEDACNKIHSLDSKSFRIKQHLRTIQKFSAKQSFNYLETADVKELRDEVSNLIIPIDEDFSAVHFDYMMYVIEFAYLINKKANRQRRTVKKFAKNILETSNIMEIQAKHELLNKVVNTDYLDKGDINIFEKIRQELRNLMKYVKKGERKNIYVNFQDEIIEVEQEDGNTKIEETSDYKLKLESYIKEHISDRAIQKIRKNEVLDNYDLNQLNKIVENTLGDNEKYKKEYGDEKLVTFIRSQVGLDINTVKQLFAKFIDEKKYNSKQINFVNQVIDYVAQNGLMRSFEVLKSAPFNNEGSFVELYENNYNDFAEIRKIIEDINERAGLAA